jgi:putative transposase
MAMPDYRRNRIPGATYFFTVNLFDRSSGLLVTHIDALREPVRQVRRRSPFGIDAWVVLPDHMHCLWTLPQGDCDFSGRWRALKKAFSKSLPDTEPRSPAAHMDYIHFNPVKHGLVEGPGEWPFSSFRRCVAAKLYPADWLGSDATALETGERS